MQAQFGGKYPHLFRGLGAGLSRADFFCSDQRMSCRSLVEAIGGALATVLMSDVPAFALEPAKTVPAHQSDER